MSLLKKMFTAARGAANEAGEEFVDGQALRILDQEIRDATVELKKSKVSLADIMGKKKIAERAADAVKVDIKKYEEFAGAALENDDMELATECAEKVAGLEEELAPKAELAATFANSEGNLKAAIKQAETNLRRIQQQVDTVKATEQVQKAQAATASAAAGTTTGLSSAADSLNRIKERQANTAARMEAAQELADGTDSSDLDAKLKAAGIGGSSGGTNDVLARLKAKKAKKDAKKA